MAKTIADTLPLLNGRTMPTLGFGVWRSPADLSTASCLAALRSNYRHIDSAQLYKNEAEVGQAVRESGIPRDQLFLTTKIRQPAGSPALSYDRCAESVRKMDAGDAGAAREGYVDLFLVHSAKCGSEGRRELWLALERLYKEGRARSIGVSNYGIGHIEEMREYATVWPPHVNQLELHPWTQQVDIVRYCEDKGIVVQAYCPIVRNRKAEDPTLLRVAGKHGVTGAQVLIRYSLQKGWVPLPKSDNEGRIRANADVFGFELDGEDMAALDALDEGPAGAIVGAVANELE
ncbi:Prostaglandin F synthase [Escovopsis weberi]|uniref:Prostaglandin F synthase n=1 Tax=Escovopsis weberi TaxID=150374 RepID=A0A0M9VUZ4_ESCWE|nr:Prostaglandin F synthase [Escovopsis weberi]